MNEFLPALIALREAGREVVLEQLHQLFQRIARTTNPDELVAAVQTLRTAGDQLEMGDDPVLVRLIDSLRVQMLLVCRSKELSSDARVARDAVLLDQRFEQALGQQIRSPYPRKNRSRS